MNINSIENVTKKLQIYLNENNLSVLKLSQLIGMKYQTLKRIVELEESADSLPNISSIILLATFFKCTLAELIDNKLILNARCFESLDNYLNNKQFSILKIYIPIEQYKHQKNIKSIFVINVPSAEKNEIFVNDIPYKSPTTSIQAFVEMNNVEYDGFYIAKINNKIKMVNVLSVSSSFIMIEEVKKINKIEKNKVEIFAKYIATGTTIQEANQILIARAETSK